MPWCLFCPVRQAVQEEILIPGSFVKLSYLSTRTSGYQSLLRIILTHATVPAGLSKVHVSAAIEGRLYQKWYLAAPSLVYVLSWNKTDIYGQEVWGLTEAIGMCHRNTTPWPFPYFMFYYELH